MEELAELHRFNAWANRSLLDGLRQLTDEQLEDQRDGMYDSINGVLVHLLQVEQVYLAMMRGEPARRAEGPMTLEEVATALDATGRGLVEVARGDLDEQFVVPWFGRRFTRAQGLRQVLTHSINHRADINGWLPRYGVDSTDQDYVDLVLAEAD